jgi:pyruvate/2-oxoglutarate dehydrogenase complex dihydrolipoamide dehydrogenase (E3) component
MMPERFDAIVIGAGEAGAVVGSRAVAVGHRVAMVYRPPYGRSLRGRLTRVGAAYDLHSRNSLASSGT